MATTLRGSDNFDTNNELENMLRAEGKNAQAGMVCNIIPQ